MDLTDAGRAACLDHGQGGRKPVDRSVRIPAARVGFSQLCAAVLRAGRCHTTASRYFHDQCAIAGLGEEAGIVLKPSASR